MFTFAYMNKLQARIILANECIGVCGNLNYERMLDYLNSIASGELYGYPNAQQTAKMWAAQDFQLYIEKYGVFDFMNYIESLADIFEMPIMEN